LIDLAESTWPYDQDSGTASEKDLGVLRDHGEERFEISKKSFVFLVTLIPSIRMIPKIPSRKCPSFADRD
jgi:hypothetical protein